jgi:antirestriction protein
MTTTVILSEVKIYVGTYAKYNNGSIFGEWLTLGDFDNLEDFYTKCKEIHADEKDPEFMLQDYETPDILKNFVSECGINENIFEVAEMLEGKDIEMLEAYFSLGHDITEANIEEAEERFFGYFEDYEELGEEYANQTGLLYEVPENLKYYFDFEKFGRDLSYDLQEFNGYYFFN